MMKNKRNHLAQVFHFSLQGKRDEKYDFLNQNSLKSIAWNELNPDEPNYFLVDKNFEGRGTYEKGFTVDELFNLSSSGIKTHRDHFVIDFEKEILLKRINEFYNSNYSDIEIGKKLNLKDNRDWSISIVRKTQSYNPEKIVTIVYRPFDNRSCYYDSSLIDFGRENVMKHFLKGPNLGLSLLRQSRAGGSGNYWINKTIVGKDAISSLDTCTIFPLYLYPETNAQQTIAHGSYSPLSESLSWSIGRLREARTPNLSPKIIKQIAEKLDLVFVPEKEPEGNVCYINNPEVRDDFKTTFAPIDLLDYIYAVLHSPTYREKYKEFLKIDFPRVPYPKDTNTFWKLVKLGGEIRQIHLLESPSVERYITQYPIDGSNEVGKIVYENNRVYINYEKATASGSLEGLKYFDNVPETAWSFYIGGYQPAQKWLKDRKGRKLEFEDILHYQKIIVALAETERLMKEIDKIQIE